MALDPIEQTICPVPLTLKALRGDSIDVRLRLFDARTGRPLVLTGWSGEAFVYESANGSVPKHTLVVDVDQSAASMPTTGVVLITSPPPAGTTKTWIEFGSWALQLTLGTVRKTISAGPWILSSVSIAQPTFTCSIGGFGAACSPETVPFGLAGGDCAVLENGYTRILLPHPAGACGCA